MSKTTTKSAKTSTKGTKATAESNGKAPRAKADLTSVKVRILKALSKAPAGLTGTELSSKAEIDPSSVGNQAGYRDPEINSRPVHASNLLNKGYTKLSDTEDRGYVYTITAAGRKAISKAE